MPNVDLACSNEGAGPASCASRASMSELMLTAAPIMICLLEWSYESSWSSATRDMSTMHV
eukprot:24423-Eustigmatos_ZCMA.PRE.1